MSNPGSGFCSQQVEPHTFLLVLILLFSPLHLPRVPLVPVSLPLVLLLSSFVFLLCLPLLGYLWNLLSRDIGNQIVHEMELGLCDYRVELTILPLLACINKHVFN